MAGTLVSARSAPERIFENYVFTRVVDPNAGLTKINDRQFTQLTAATERFDEDASFVVIPIGFPFKLDGITYDHIAVDPNGFAALVDPTQGTFAINEVMTGFPDNASIRPTFTSQAVLLAPWFDDIRNVLSNAADLSIAPFSNSAEKISRYQAGLEPPTPFFNPSSYGTSYYFDIRSKKGRRLIVRWSCIANSIGTTATHIKFETVLYENGTIEFRYAPKASSPASIPLSFELESATVGVFMPNGTNRFRDFSIGLGYLDGTRQEYVYGGFVYDPNFFDDGFGPQSDGDVNVPYVHNLWASLNWPGLISAGCVMTFAPPVNRRKVLPRRDVRLADSTTSFPLVARTGDSRTGTGLLRFDDRRSPIYTPDSAPVIVNYPTTLPRFFGGNSAGVAERQDLFSHDFLVTGSTIKGSVDQWINNVGSNSDIEPFNESTQPEQCVSGLTDSYFLTGSDPRLIAPGFDQSLRSKTQIRISLPVDYNVQLPGTTSSIYYYNPRAKAWEVPYNSTYSLMSASSTPSVLDSTRAGGDWADPRPATTNGQITEDARGFGPIGNIVSSGSHVPAGSFDQTDAIIGSPYDGSLITNALNRSYPKSIRNNEEYKPTDFEVFKLPINSPFLIEKAVFEIPMAAGAGWFSDITQCFLPISGNQSFDFSGPAVTVALMRNVRLSKNQGLGSSVSRRDLILTGTIIPSTDNVSKVSIAQFAPLDLSYQIRPVGFLAYAGPAGGVVASNNSDGTFTGSISVRGAALSSVGSVLKYTQPFTAGAAADNVAGVTNFLTNVPTLVLKTSTAQTVNFQSVSPFGRGGTGFEQAGRSILGNEYVTLQGNATDKTGKTIANPLYLSGGLSSDQSALLAAAASTSFVGTVAAAIPVITHFPEPYLVMPGDELVLSISKMRPAVFAGIESSQIPSFTASLGSESHDFQLISGSINITLYGSEIKEGVEFHDTQNQLLGSNVVHEIIGAEPVVDQFDVPYRSELSGSYLDKQTVGRAVPYIFYGNNSLRGLDNNPSISPSYETDRYFSSFDSQTSTAPWSSEWSWSSSRTVEELKKTSKIANHITDTEVFWDSRIPDVSKVIYAESPAMVLAAGGGPLNNAIINSVIYTGRSSISYGDTFGPSSLPGQTHGIGDWIMTYPFEPRFGSINPTFSDKITGASYKYIVDGFGGPFGPAFFTYGGLTIEFGRISGGVRQTAGEGDGSGTSFGVGAPEFIKFFFGWGDGRNDVDNGHVTFRTYGSFNGFRTGTEVRGWRHGMISAFPLKTSAVFRRDKFGQLRDMLEQRLNTKFFSDVTGQQQVLTSPVSVRFIDSKGKLTKPEYTMSSNLSFEATSSIPYTDGVVRNREDPITSAMTNQSIVVI